MDDVKDDAKVVFRRVEVLTGPGRRRRWSAAQKSLIVSQSLEPGVKVTEVARRWQVCPQQVWGWRREAHIGGLTLPSSTAPSSALSFVPIVEAPASLPLSIDARETQSGQASSDALPSIEVRLAGAVVRVGSGTNLELLTEVLRAVRASAA